MSKKFSSFYLFCIVCLNFCCIGLRAYSISGADLTYRYLEPSLYEVTLHYYANCTDEDSYPPTNPEIRVFSYLCGVDSIQYLTRQFMDEYDNELITQLCQVLVNSNEATTCDEGSYQGVIRYVYRGVISLSAPCSDWRISFTTGLRYSGITNIENAGDKNLYIEALINNENGFVNSSPEFISSPTPFFCLETSEYDHGITEADGDELNYSVINPMDGANSLIPYQTPFSNTNPLNSTEFTIDTLTGKIHFTPAQEQTSVVTVLIKEYRNGILIGQVMRCLQFTVVTCSGPQVTITDVTQEVAVCEGNTLNLTIPVFGAEATEILGDTAELTGYTYQYSNGNGYFSWQPTSAHIGSHYLVVKAISTICPYPSIVYHTFHIFVHANATASIASEVAVCQNASALLLVETENATSYVYEWEPSDGLSCTDCPNPLVQLNNSNAYNVIITNEFGCTTSLQTSVQALPSPYVSLGEDIVISNEQHLDIFANGYYSTIDWIPKTGLNYYDIPNPQAIIDESITYIAIVTGENGCMSADTINITVKGCDQLLIPTGFSPNNDGVNDYFGVLNLKNADSFKLTIYDRWGNQVFVSNNPSVYWDGTYNGSLLPLGLYAYYCIVECSKKSFIKKGEVILIR